MLAGVGVVGFAVYDTLKNEKERGKILRKNFLPAQGPEMSFKHFVGNKIEKL